MSKVIYYISQSGENPVSDFLDSLAPKQQTKLLRVITYIKEYGVSSVIPHLKKLKGTSFWEIRILGKDNIRILYATIQNDRILLLHGFVKKSQKTPEKELAITQTRFQDWHKRTK